MKGVKSAEKPRGVIFVSIGSRILSQDILGQMMRRAEQECSSYIVCLLDSAEAVNLAVFETMTDKMAATHADAQARLLKTRLCRFRPQRGRSLRLLSTYEKDAVFCNYKTKVFNLYAANHSFHQHVNNQVYKNLQPILNRQSVYKHSDPKIQLLAKYLLLEITLKLFFACEHLAEREYGVGAEMDIINAIFSGKYPTCVDVKKVRMHYVQMNGDIQLKDINFKYPASAFGLRNVSVTFKRGTQTGIVGPNGSGKSTLLRVIAGHILPDKGQVLWGGFDLSTLGVGHNPTITVFQNGALFPHLSILENVMFAVRHRRHLRRSEARTVAVQWLERFGMKEYLREKPSQLSGGQRQRVAIARALAAEASVLLLDEPTSGLDIAQKQELMRIIRDAQSKGWLETVVIVSHDMDFILDTCKQIVVIQQGSILAQGQASDLYSNPMNARLAQMIGYYNVIPGMIQGSTFLDSSSQIRLDIPAKCEAQAGDNLCLLISPDDISIDGNGAYFTSGVIEMVVHYRGFVKLNVRVQEFQVIRCHLRASNCAVKEGDRVELHFLPERVLVVPQ